MVHGVHLWLGVMLRAFLAEAARGTVGTVWHRYPARGFMKACHPAGQLPLAA